MTATTTVWKFPLTSFGNDEAEVMMPQGAEILHFDAQGESFHLWARVNPDAEREPRRFRLAGTGHPLPTDGLSHIGTIFSGPFVWHLFELRKRDPDDEDEGGPHQPEGGHIKDEG